MPRALAEQTAAIDRTLTMPMGWMAEVYGWFLQNSFLHALKVQGMPLWEHWRLRACPAVRTALAAAGEVEALAALSAYAYERPADRYPELVDEGPLFAGEGMAHPLMPPGVCVPNDLSLGGERRLMLISGSNMSGKSTLMRRSEPTPYWPWPVRRCGLRGSRFRPSCSGRPCAFAIAFTKGLRISTRS